MPYIYRYIDLNKGEVCYVGKVTTDKDSIYYNGLRQRHKQHQYEEWYKRIGDENLLLEYIQLQSHADADILETYLIQFYDTGQLFNKAKVGWGKPSIDLWPIVSGRWLIYGVDSYENKESIRRQIQWMVDCFFKETEELHFNDQHAIEMLEDHIKEIRNNIIKAGRISRYDAQDLFLRTKMMEVDHAE